MAHTCRVRRVLSRSTALTISSSPILNMAVWSMLGVVRRGYAGDKQWLRKIYPVIKNSLEDDYKTIYDAETGLVHGETSFID
mgnify:CR=1 FL=1